MQREEKLTGLNAHEELQQSALLGIPLILRWAGGKKGETDLAIGLEIWIESNTASPWKAAGSAMLVQPVIYTLRGVECEYTDP